MGYAFWMMAGSFPLVEVEESVYTTLPQSQCIHVMDKTYAFIANRYKLYISPELVEMVYNKVEKNEVLEVAAIHQGLKTFVGKQKIFIGRAKTRKNSYEALFSSEAERTSITYRVWRRWDQWSIVNNEVKYVHCNQHKHWTLCIISESSRRQVWHQDVKNYKSQKE